MIESVKGSQVDSRHVYTELERAGLAELLMKADINELLRLIPERTDITIEDFKAFLAERAREYLHVVDPVAVMTQSAEPADLESYMQMSDGGSGFFPMHSESAELSDDERQLFLQSSAASLGKGMVRGGSFGKTSGGGVGASTDELVDTAEETLQDEFDEFMIRMSDQMLTAEIAKEWKEQEAVMKKDLQRIVAMCKSGQIGVEWAFIALCKVNVAKNGMLFTHRARQAFNLNEVLRNVEMDVTNPATMQEAQMRTREVSMQMQLVVSDLQKIIQNTATTLESIKGINDEIFRTQREIKRHLDVQR